MPSSRRRARSALNSSAAAAATSMPTVISRPADKRFAVYQDETLTYRVTSPTTTTNHGGATTIIPHGPAPTGTLHIRLSSQTCPGFSPPPTCLCLEYHIPAGIQVAAVHPHPGVPYPQTTRTAFLPNNDEGCQLLARFRVAFQFGYMFKVGTSLATRLDDQVCWHTIPHKTSLHGGPFGFPDVQYVAKAHAELDKLNIPPAHQCLSLAPAPPVVPTTTLAGAAAPALSFAAPPAHNPFYVPPATATTTGLGFGGAASMFGFAATTTSNNPAPAAGNNTAHPTVVYECIEYTAPKSLDIAITADLFDVPTDANDDCAICLEKLCQTAKSVKIKACQHEFHLSCLQDSLKHNPRCPTCRKPLDCARGKSPSGTMTIQATNNDCPGFGTGVKAIEITYKIPSGKQMDYHENPKQRYSGTTRVAYLPNTVQGQKLLRRLKYAWKHGLTFRVGRSLTTGLANQVTWTSIHHKTSLHG